MAVSTAISQGNDKGMCNLNGQNNYKHGLKLKNTNMICIMRSTSLNTAISLNKFKSMLSYLRKTMQDNKK